VLVIKRFILGFLTLFLIWFLLTGNSAQELAFGAITAVILSLIFSNGLKVMEDIRLTPKAIVYAVIYFFVFLTDLVKSNFDVAFRVISPSLPINPGIVKVKTRLKSKLGRIMLANSITLTPGTLTVETSGDYFYIHWIDVSAENIDQATQKIVSKFEKYLEVIFG